MPEKTNNLNNEATIWWLWDVEVKVRLNTEDRPLRTYTLPIPARNRFDAEMVGRYEAAKKGTLRTLTAKRIDVAFAYFPYRTGMPMVSVEQRQQIWDRYQSGELIEDRTWIEY